MHHVPGLSAASLQSLCKARLNDCSNWDEVPGDEVDVTFVQTRKSQSLVWVYFLYITIFNTRMFKMFKEFSIKVDKTTLANKVIFQYFQILTNVVRIRALTEEFVMTGSTPTSVSVAMGMKVSTVNTVSHMLNRDWLTWKLKILLFCSGILGRYTR